MRDAGGPIGMVRGDLIDKSKVKAFMKSFVLTVIWIFLLNVGYTQSYNTIHCLGNGDYCVYEDGIDIIQVFGPPYSSPSLFSVKLQSPEVQVETKREPGTDIYVHTLFKNGNPIGTITDFVSSRLSCFYRISNLTEPVSFLLSVNDLDGKVSISDYPRYRKEYGVNNSLLVTANPGAYVYHTYPSPFETNHQVLSKGSTDFAFNPERKNEYFLEFGKGQGLFSLVGGPSFQELNDHLQAMFNQSPESLLAQTRSDWHTFMKSQSNFTAEIRNKNPDKKQFLQAIDDVSVLLKTQQSKDGGVLAGHYYHLAYIRDQYGVSRAFLSLGYHDRARQILNFYFHVWKQFGYICNAQAMGIPGIFHRHENDEVEITGYLLIQAFDYLEKTKDSEFVSQIMPFLEWCWEAQKKNLVDYMLPFNGDETYIAGGMVSRKALNDGSSEATLLFIEGGRKFLNYAKSSNLKNKQWLQQDSELLDKVSEHYRDNFVKNGRLLVNNPRRAELCTFPEYRHGVCLYPGHGGYCGILKHYKASLYFCKECFGKADQKIEPEVPEEFYLPSVYLMPIYIGSTLFSGQEKESMLNELVARYQETGQITISQQDNRLLGYDYGLFLYALTEFNHPLAGEIYRKMMDLRDKSGTWSEYYQNDVPTGCRYRPWESGINMEAAINYVTKKNNDYK